MLLAWYLVGLKNKTCTMQTNLLVIIPMTGRNGGKKKGRRDEYRKQRGKCNWQRQRRPGELEAAKNRKVNVKGRGANTGCRKQNMSTQGRQEKDVRLKQETTGNRRTNWW